MDVELESTQLPNDWGQTGDTLKILLQAALVEFPFPTNSSSASSSKNHENQMNGDDKVFISEKEATQLRVIKRLMQVKGYERMMKFLES